MKTITLDVGGMLSILDCRTVETQLGKIPGVYHATASTASSSMIAEYDRRSRAWRSPRTRSTSVASIAPAKSCPGMSANRISGTREPRHD